MRLDFERVSMFPSAIFQEDEAPLTAEPSLKADPAPSKTTVSKSEQFVTQGRKETQPFLNSTSSSGGVNPVPNITL